MSSYRIPSHRPRSHSTSTSPVLQSPARRASTKRSHHSGPSYPDFSSPQKWDVDVWRRGKRARREVSPSLHSVNTRPHGGHSSSSSQSSLSASSAPPTPVFPTTSAEFHLFPNQKRNSKINPRCSTPSFDSSSSFTFTNVDIELHPNESDLTRLRSNAFWELQRSVVENGEGLVRRMRDFEDSRSRSVIYAIPRNKKTQGKGRKRTSPAESVNTGRDVLSEDEDDIQIFAGEKSDMDGGPRKKRALSLGLMDASSAPFTGLGLDGSERCSSPGATCDSASSPSAYPSDDEGILPDTARKFSLPASDISPSSITAFTPALSQTYSISTNSSLVSLPLPPPLRHFTNDLCSNPSSPFDEERPIVSLKASRTEKAIAALSLAMANGAGGLNDYEALRSIQTLPTSDEIGQVGELWH